MKILRNLDQMKRVTIYDVAELTNSSRTTVWRMLQKLGYPSFSDFKFALQSAASQYVYYNRMIDRRKNVSTAGLIGEMERQLATAGEIYKACVSEELVEELTELIFYASRVYFFMPFRTASIYSFQQNLWKSGKDTCYDCLVPDMLEAAEQLDDRSIVIMSTIEYTETIDLTEVFEKIKQTGSVIWLAGETSSRYAGYVDRQIMMLEAKPASWLLAFECLIITLSECYRGKYIDHSGN